MLSSFYIASRLYWVLGALVALAALAHFVPALLVLARLAVGAGAALVVLDAVLLWGARDGVTGRRDVAARLSMGDANAVAIHLRSAYRFSVRVRVLDEAPVAFQLRDAAREVSLAAGGRGEVRYVLRPVRRGAYGFGHANAYAATPIGLLERRYRVAGPEEVAVYPSFLQMRRYELLALSNRLEEAGVKRLRRLGHTMEFDHVREYVVGDDVRTVNWKATARRGALQVNQTREERGQPVYVVLDAGRVMRMPFAGMTLLDYGVNAALVLGNVALMRGDRAGLVTVSDTIGVSVPAQRGGGHVVRLQEALYRVETGFPETDFGRLYVHMRRLAPTRSLLVICTNFETRDGMRRQLPYLRALARRHLVVVAFFENTELDALLEAPPGDTEGVYTKAVAEKHAWEKREIVAELRGHGIYAVLTPPEGLTADTVNAYLDFKGRGMI